MASVFWPKGWSPHLSVLQTSVYYNLEVSATRYPEKDAVIFYDTRMSYRALRHDVDRLAGFLQRRCCISRGDRVLLYSRTVRSSSSGITRSCGPMRSSCR